jgi:hypothetical protein
MSKEALVMMRLPSKALGLAALLALVVPASSSAQDEASSTDATRVRFDDLELASDPAFVLLGISPEKVDRPTEVSDVAISLRTASDDFSAVPKSYAVSLAPFWLTQRRNVRYSDWAGKSLFPVWRTLSLSAASHTVSEEDPQAPTTTRMAVGIRTSLLQGEVEPAFEEAVASDLARLRAVAREIRDRLLVVGGGGLAGGIIEACDAAQGRPSQALFDELRDIMAGQDVVDPELYAKWKEFAGSFAAGEPPDSVQNALDELKDLAETRDLNQAYDAAEIEDLVQKLAASKEMNVKTQVPGRMGFNVDLAGAASWDFPGQVAKAGKLASGAGWLSLAYDWTSWSAVAITRATGRRDARPAYDLGGRALVDIAGAISPSLEGVVRWQPRETPDYSLSLVVESSVGDSKSLVFAFGRDFQPDLKDSLIATLQFVIGTGSAKWFGSES